jgi:hypothetical protein
MTWYIIQKAPIGGTTKSNQSRNSIGPRGGPGIVMTQVANPNTAKPSTIQSNNFIDLESSGKKRHDSGLCTVGIVDVKQAIFTKNPGPVATG